MKQQYTFILFILFSLLQFPFIMGVFGEDTFYGSLWDGISFAIVYVLALFFYLMTFGGTKKSSNKFFIYKLIWLQEIFIIAGILGSIIGFVFFLATSKTEMPPDVDPFAVIVSNLAIIMITILYGFMGALSLYLIQKFHEMKSVIIENHEIAKPKEGFYFSSLVYFILNIISLAFTIYICIDLAGGANFLVSMNQAIFGVVILILLIMFYRGNSFVGLIKNLFWYIPDTKDNIVYNLKYIREMKKIMAMFIVVSLLCAPIVMMASLAMPPTDTVNLFGIPFDSLINGGFQFILVICIILLLNVIEGREATKLYYETGKISAGDRFYSLKYIMVPTFLLIFTFTFGMIISIIF